MNFEPYRYGPTSQVITGGQSGQPEGYDLSAARSPFLVALFAFPLMVLTSFFWPSAAGFARQRRQAHVGVLVVLLLLLAAGVGALMYAWGRGLTLDRGVTALSVGRVVPQVQSTGSIVVLALVAPLLVMGFAYALQVCARGLQGRGKYREQLYSTLVIGTPLALLVLLVALVITGAPDLAAVARLPLAIVLLVLLGYGLFLHVLALMGVQGFEMGKAVRCLLAALLVVALLVAVVGMLSDGGTNNGHEGGGQGDSRFKRSAGWGGRGERTCPRCGFSLEVYDRLHPDLTQTCPRCGGML